MTLAENVKRRYEAMFLADASVASANWDGVVETIGTIMTRADADVVSLRKWDERRLAYEIAGQSRGAYILCYFNAAPDRIGGVERDVQLNEQLLRVLILQADHLSEEEIAAETPALRAQRQEETARQDAEAAAAKTAERRAAEAAEASAAEGAVDEPAAVETASEEAVAVDPAVAETAKEDVVAEDAGGGAESGEATEAGAGDDIAKDGSEEEDEAPKTS